MTDAAAILASLDRFIGQLARQAELTSSHRVATQISPMATTLTILATQNQIPSSELITNDAIRPPVLAKIPVRVSRVKFHLWVVTVVRVVSPLKIKHLPVAIAKMPVVRVVTAIRINGLRAT